MIHFTCDGCDRQIDTAHEPRFVLRLEVYAAPESVCESHETSLLDAQPVVDTDRDHLAELDEMLECCDDFTDEPSSNGFASEDLADGYRQLRYDLCRECRKRMLSNPLARVAMSKIDFSDN